MHSLMQVRHLSYPLENDGFPEQVMAIGYFDGVHIGHRLVIDTAVSMARTMDLPVGVMTFHPHPRVVLGQMDNAAYLTPLPEKVRQFQQLGVDHTYVVSFTRSFAAVHPEEFIESFLMRLKPKGVVVGFDYTFGHRAQGTAETLRELSRGRYRLEVVEPVTLEGEKVSSTLVREMLHEGCVERAGRLLGRPYCVEGEVVTGEQRGRTIGFPTANLALREPYFIPRTGVYVVGVQWRDRRLYGVANLGYKPTFHERAAQLSLEIHLLDFYGDLYGETLRVEFFHFLRTEKKFPSVEALIRQIHADIDQARRWIQSHRT